VSTVRASVSIPGRRIAQVEELWYDRTRWPSFVDGLKHVHAVEGDYPQAGSVVKWESFPGGRGRVLEKVVAYEPRTGQQLDVQDTQIRGRQTLRFDSLDDGAVRISLELEYEVKERSTFTPLVDLLFVRRAQTDSLRRTLVRFARELDAEPAG
jgi:polyketide cyclase/dehydrase/lipid transport protein